MGGWRLIPRAPARRSRPHGRPHCTAHSGGMHRYSTWPYCVTRTALGRRCPGVLTHVPPTSIRHHPYARSARWACVIPARALSLAFHVPLVCYAYGIGSSMSWSLDIHPAHTRCQPRSARWACVIPARALSLAFHVPVVCYAFGIGSSMSWSLGPRRSHTRSQPRSARWACDIPARALAGIFTSTPGATRRAGGLAHCGIGSLMTIFTRVTSPCCFCPTSHALSGDDAHH